MRLIRVLFAVVVLVGITTGLQELKHEEYTLAPEWRAIKVESEQQLRKALNNPSLGWADRRVIQLSNDLLLSATVTISGPVRIEGNCNDAATGRCIIRAARPTPLVHVSGPSALVQFGNLEFVGGQSNSDMGGAITASNQSQIEMASCILTTNSAAGGGGALLISDNSHVTLVNSEISGNVAGQQGGAVHVADGTLHLDSSVIRGNSAANGGGVYISAGSLMTSVDSFIQGNMMRSVLSSSSSSDETMEKEQEGDDSEENRGDDLVVEKAKAAGAKAAEAFFHPLPEATTEMSVGGVIQPLSSLKRKVPGESASVEEFGTSEKNVVPSAVAAAALAKSTATAAATLLGGRKGAAGAGFTQKQQQQQVEVAVVDEVQERRDRRPIAEEIPIGRALPRHHGRSLMQTNGSPFPSGARVVNVANEEQLASAFKNRERYINLIGHISLSGAFTGDKALVPSIKASVTIQANCPEPYNGKCLIKGGGNEALLFADNTGFLPGMEVQFNNMIFTNGRALESGGAFSNSGAMSVTFENCEFYNNEAGMGGAVALVEGAFGVFTDCIFKKNGAATDGSGAGTGGAVLLTGQSGFTRVVFDSNMGQNGGAVGVGGSSQGIFFDGCTFTDNSAVIFGNDIYMESWVVTVAYFNPFPTSAEVYTNPANLAPMSTMPPMYYPATVTSPPPSPPAPPSPPPPAPPRPPNPKLYIYSEDQLWDALNNGNTTITLGAHIQFAKQGRWALSPPPPVISEVRIISRCEGYGEMCIIDMANTRFPLLDVQSGGIIKMYNVRVLNGATMQDGGAVRLSAPRRALFDTCDFIGNFAANGGAVSIKGAQDVMFQDCNFGLNYADSIGGAVYMVGSSVYFAGSSFYFNTANSGGAIAMGPGSKAFVLDANFTRNVASKWGPDVFITTPVGSTLYLKQWPPESVARIFPPQASIQAYYAPPPVPPSPTSPPPNFKRAPYPPPGPLPPARMKQPPPSPPNPPPNPPPRPPSPPLDHYNTSTPVMYGPLYLSFFLVVTLGSLIYLIINHKKFIKRVKDPEELRARLAGEWDASSDEDFSLDEYPGISGLEPEEEEVITSALAAAAVRRRQTGEAAYMMAAGTRGESQYQSDALVDDADSVAAGPSHTKRS